jgi:hypothetical protein
MKKRKRRRVLRVFFCEGQMLVLLLSWVPL